MGVVCYAILKVLLTLDISWEKPRAAVQPVPVLTFPPPLCVAEGQDWGAWIILFNPRL